MQTIQAIAVVLILIMGIFWTLLPWGFGLHNFIRSHHQYLGWIARVSWISLLCAHFGLAYLFWFEDVSYWWLLSLAAGHILFLMLFGRDVGTS